MAGDVDARPVGGLSGGGALLCGLALRRRREVLLHLGLDILHVEVAHGDDGHQIGPVPALVVSAQALHGRVLDDLGAADRSAAGVERGAEEEVEQVLLEARVEPLVEAPLLQHHATLELDLFRVERYREGPVAENLEGGLGDFGIVGRNLQKVQGVVEAGPGVKVGAEGAADGLEVFDDLLLGEAFGAVEGHVLH